MTIDKAQLMALAERVATDRRFCSDEYHRELAAGVKALFAELDRLELDNRSLKGSCARLGAEHAGMTRTLKKANRMQFEARQERDQFKAELAGLRTGYEAQSQVIAELRKDAERYWWLRQRQLPLDGHDFLSTQEILDRRIDAAIASEVSHG